MLWIYSVCLESYLLAGYRIPKSKGGPPEPSASLPWQPRKRYKSVPSQKSTSKRLVDLAEALDEGYYEPPVNPSESSASGPTSAAASNSWAVHPWEPTEEDLT